MANNRVIGVKKSEFVTDNTIPDAATLDYVDNGQNKKIVFSDFLSLLGTTGSIIQVGDIGAIPVLDKQGTINGIRNVVSGPGVAVALTSQNGIQFSTSFSYDTTGAVLVDDTTSLTQNFRSIVAGSDVDITTATGTITVAVDRLNLVPTQEVIVNNRADLPVAVEGVIIGVANTTYVLGDDVSIGTDRIDVSAGGISFVGINQFANVLTYTGTGNMFSGTDVSFDIQNIRITCPNGTAFNFSSVASPGTQIFLMQNVQLLACAAIGTFNALQSITIAGSFAASATQGITVTGSTFAVISIVKFAMISASASFIGVDLGTSITAGGEFSNLIVLAPAGAIGVKGAAANANIVAGGLFTFRDSSFSGGLTTEISGITADDIRWAFDQNTGIADTQPDAIVSLDANATTTTIATINTPVLVAGTWVEQRASHFTSTAAGRITYVGERPITTPIDVVVDIEPASGTNKDLTTYIAINGSVIVASGRKIRTDTLNPLNAYCPWQVQLNPNDFIEIWVENNTDTIDILVSGSVFRVR